MTKSVSNSKVFELLGAGGDDIEALTAYALYKRHKRQWALEFREIHDRFPNVADNRAFSVVAETPDQLERYKKDARDFLIAFAEQTVESSRSEIEREAITSRIEAAANKIDSQTSLGRQVMSGIVATAITTLLYILLAIGIRLFGIDLLDVLDKLSTP
jgi:hypothetical protein